MKTVHSTCGNKIMYLKRCSICKRFVGYMDLVVVDGVPRHKSDDGSIDYFLHCRLCDVVVTWYETEAVAGL